MSVLDQALPELSERCQDEVIRFARKQSKVAVACFELFRRALTEDIPQAFTAIFGIFESQVRSWVTQHSSFWHTNCSPDHFVSIAFSNFYFALRGKQLDKLSSAAQLLGYLKACVHSAILQQLRIDSRHQFIEIPWDEDNAIGTFDPFQDIDFEDLWNRLCVLIPAEIDRLLMRCAFVEGMKPIDIAKAYPQHWDTPRKVTIALYRIRQLLRGDSGLRGLAGLKP